MCANLEVELPPLYAIYDLTDIELDQQLQKARSRDPNETQPQVQKFISLALQEKNERVNSAEILDQLLDNSSSASNCLLEDLKLDDSILMPLSALSEPSPTVFSSDCFPPCISRYFSATSNVPNSQEPARIPPSSFGVSLLLPCDLSISRSVQKPDWKEDSGRETKERRSHPTIPAHILQGGKSVASFNSSVQARPFESKAKQRKRNNKKECISRASVGNSVQVRSAKAFDHRKMNRNRPTELKVSFGGRTNPNPQFIVSDTSGATLSDTTPTTLSDTTPATLSDTTPTTLSDTTPATLSDTTPTTLSDTTAATLSDTTAATLSDTTAATLSDTTPTTLSDTTPTTLSDTPSATLSDTTAATLSDTAVATLLITSENPTKEPSSSSVKSHKDNNIDAKSLTHCNEQDCQTVTACRTQISQLMLNVDDDSSDSDGRIEVPDSLDLSLSCRENNLESYQSKSMRFDAHRRWTETIGRQTVLCIPLSPSRVAPNTIQTDPHTNSSGTEVDLLSFGINKSPKGKPGSVLSLDQISTDACLGGPTNEQQITAEASNEALETQWQANEGPPLTMANETSTLANNVEFVDRNNSSSCESECKVLEIPIEPEILCPDYSALFPTIDHMFAASWAPTAQSCVRQTLLQKQVYSTVSSSPIHHALSQLLQNIDAFTKTATYHPEFTNSRLLYRITGSHPEVYAIVRKACNKQGWSELHEAIEENLFWNLMWSWSKPPVDARNLFVWQKVNHFSSSRQLTRKDCLRKHIESFLSLGPRMKELFNIIPQTFVLPKDYVNFVETFGKFDIENRARNVWIMKPVAMSRGRGISVMNDLSQLSYATQLLVQKYIMNPMLVKGHKLDLRLYVCVTSFNPLEAFLYHEGFARFSTMPYTNDPKQLSNRFVHLTNYSIQKENVHASSSVSDPDKYGGSKISLQYWRELMRQQGVEVGKLWQDIIDVIIKSLICVEQHIPKQSNCFELFGYDILVDDESKPWLIEVNASPAMDQETELDKKIKPRLIYDTIKLVDALPYDRLFLCEILRRRKQTGTWYASTARSKEEYRKMISQVFHKLFLGRMPRKYGDLPQNMGAYERIIPSDAYLSINRIRRNIGK